MIRHRQTGADSFRHRQAGAMEVAIVSGRRWALMHELRGEDEPTLDAILSRLAPSDIVLVEGYKARGAQKDRNTAAGGQGLTPLSQTIRISSHVAADLP